MTSMCPCMPVKPASGLPSPLRSRNIQPMSGWLTCTSFSLTAVPERQPLDLNRGVVVGRRAAAVLGIGPHHQREGVLVIQRQRTAGQLDPDAGGHSFFGSESLQMGIISREAVVFRAGGELDVLAKQVQYAAKLAGRVVAGRAGMAVEVGADPTVGLHGADQFRLENRLLASSHVDSA